MPARVLRRAAAVAAVALALGAAPVAPAGAQLIPDEVPEKIRGLELTDQAGRKLPLDLVFTDSSGEPVRLGDLFNRPGEGVAAQGRPVIVVMQYFRCPLLCPKITQEVMRSLNELDGLTIGSEFDIIFVSFDPRDTAVDAARQKTDALLEYNRSTTESIKAGMRFLTGPAANSRALADALGYAYRYLPDSGEYAHGSAIFVITPDGTVSRTLSGLRFPVRDLRLALVEAADGKIGSLADRFTLWCYHFDPREGSYVLQAMRVMRVGGALTVLLLGGLVGVMFLGERRRRRERAAAAEGGETTETTTTQDRRGTETR